MKLMRGGSRGHFWKRGWNGGYDIIPYVRIGRFQSLLSIIYGLIKGRGSFCGQGEACGVEIV